VQHTIGDSIMVKFFSCVITSTKPAVITIFVSLICIIISWLPCNVNGGW